MNELQIFSSDIIPVYLTDTGEKVVVGRELHERLRIASKYADWFKNMCGYGFTDDCDYTSFSKNLESGGRTIEHLLKLDMAKEIAMIQRTPEGHAIRKKLIELDTNVAELSPELRLLINLEIKQKQQAAALVEVNDRLDNISEIVSLDANAWRDRTKAIIVKIAEKWGGNEYIPEVHRELYKLLETTAHVSLKRRLNGRLRRMAIEGASKTAMSHINNLDIIADDPKLVPIYLDLVKRLAIKWQVDVQRVFNENGV